MSPRPVLILQLYVSPVRPHPSGSDDYQLFLILTNPLLVFLFSVLFGFLSAPCYFCFFGFNLLSLYQFLKEKAEVTGLRPQ